MKKLRLSIRPKFTVSHQGEGPSSKELYLNEMLLAMENGGHLAQAALGIEQVCVDIIKSYFFKEELPSKLPAMHFQGWILDANFCSFENKRTLLINIIDHLKLIPKERNKFEKGLSVLIRYRNAFAHGTISQKNDKIVISYFRGGQQEEELTDAFWAEIEDHFNFVDTTIMEIFKTVCINSKDKS